jgi:hypothetical protein
MAKQEQIQFHIPEPCTVPWSGMKTVNEIKRFCDSCEKEVIDFSRMTDGELISFFTHKPQGICGRLRQDQLNRSFTIPQKVLLEERSNWWKAALILPFALLQNACKTPLSVLSSQSSPTKSEISKEDTIVHSAKQTDSLPQVQIPSTITLIAHNPEQYKFVWQPETLTINPVDFFHQDIIVTAGAMIWIMPPYGDVVSYGNVVCEPPNPYIIHVDEITGGCISTTVQEETYLQMIMQRLFGDKFPFGRFLVRNKQNEMIIDKEKPNHDPNEFTKPITMFAHLPTTLLRAWRRLVKQQSN